MKTTLLALALGYVTMNTAAAQTFDTSKIPPGVKAPLVSAGVPQ